MPGGRGVPEQRHGFEEIFHVVERVPVCVDLVMDVLYYDDNAGKLSHVTRYSSEMIEEVGFSFCNRAQELLYKPTYLFQEDQDGVLLIQNPKWLPKPWSEWYG